MAIEQSWVTVPPRALTSNGTSLGEVNVVTTAGFKVKQSVVIQSSVVGPINVQVKRVVSRTQLIVGPLPENIQPKMKQQGSQLLSVRQDISAYTTADGAFIYAVEQQKNGIKPDDIIQAIYRQEPGTTIGVEIDDQWGNPIDSVVDNNGINRLAVDGQFHAEVDVQVDVDIDGFYDPTTNPDPDNIGLIGHLRSNPTGQPQQTQRITAKRGTVDINDVSMDVSLHDQNGNKYDIANPLPVTGSFEKFFQLIGDSGWMNQASYDEVVPTYSAGNTILTLAYKEDSAIIGEAIITFTALDVWSVKLNRYLNKDDGSHLLGDDGEPLLLS